MIAPLRSVSLISAPENRALRNSVLANSAPSKFAPVKFPFLKSDFCEVGERKIGPTRSARYSRNSIGDAGQLPATAGSICLASIPLTVASISRRTALSSAAAFEGEIWAATSPAANPITDKRMSVAPSSDKPKISFCPAVAAWLWTRPNTATTKEIPITIMPVIEFSRGRI